MLRHSHLRAMLGAPAGLAVFTARPWSGARLAVCALTVALGACATYAPLPLGRAAGVASVGELAAPVADTSPAGLVPHRFDPADGLDVTEVAMLAVANNPALKVARDDLGIARAQAFAAGLLPDPQLSLGADFPVYSGPGLSKAFDLGLGEDVTALLTRSSRRRAARDHVAEVNLDLLWAEWQTVAQARQLFNQVMTLRAQLARLQLEDMALAPVDRLVQAALAAGNLSYDSASAGLGASAEVRQRLGDTALQLHQADSSLHVLLGLAATAPLDLVGPADAGRPTAAQVQQALRELPQRRPDLLALEAGYRAQDARLRGAILAQFPALTVGFNTARDTSAIYSKGFSIGISLPLFDGNRGNIAIERATRVQLKDAYAERLLDASSDVQRLQADLATLQGREAQLAAHARQLDAGGRAAARAWQRQLLDWPTYLAIRGNVLNADLDLLGLRQQQAEAAIALQALLGRADAVSAIGKPHP